MLQRNSLLTMLVHVFASPVYASPIHVTAQGTNSLLKQSLTLCIPAVITTITAGFPAMFTFPCREDCSHQWRWLPKWGVHCKLQWGMMCWSIKVCHILLANCIIIISCLFYHPLPVLHLSPELRSTTDQVLGHWQSSWETWSQCLLATVLCLWAGRTP